MNFINNDISFVYDNPAQYNSLVIYPITIGEMLEFNCYVDCLLVDKNSIGDIKIISMSYLDYILKYTDEKNFYYQKLLALLKMCVKLDIGMKSISEEEAVERYNSGEDIIISKTENFEKDSIRVNNLHGISWEMSLKLVKTSIGRKPFYFREETIKIVEKKGKTFIYLKDSFYSTTDFDKIKKIILDQNDIKQIDEHTSKQVRDELDKREKIANDLRGGTKVCGFEEQMISLSIALGITIEEVKKITIRKFNKYIRRINHKIDYETFTVGYMAAGVDGKKHKYPSHWMADLDSERKYSSILLDESARKEVEKKIS